MTTALSLRLRGTGKSGYYFVAFTMRSGSTVICHDLGRLDLGEPREWFQEDNRVGRPASDYVIETVTQSRGELFGFKATWDQVQALCRALEAEGDPVPLMDLRNVFPGLRVVHLVRRDKVRQAISLWRAATSGTWHIADHAGTEAGRPDYDLDALQSYFIEVVCEDWMWMDHFARTGSDVLTVAYEDYLVDPLATIERICKHIGAWPRRGRSQWADRPRIMRDEWTDQIAERFVADVRGPRRPGTVAQAARTYWAQVDLRSYLRRIDELDGRLFDACHVGAGYGLMSAVLSESCRNVVAFERDLELVHAGRAQYSPEVHFVAVADLRALPAADASFDLVLLIAVLQAVDDEAMARVADEVKRIVRPGGFVLLCEETDPAHFWRDTRSVDGSFTIGRSMAAYEAAFAPMELVATSPRRVERSYPRQNVGSYMLLRLPSR
jgi:LPS sulfotransferase NodH